MKNKELYHKTIDILVKAYLNDTLVHYNCQACAVGNIIAGCNDYKYIIHDKACDVYKVRWNHTNHPEQQIHWYEVFGTTFSKQFFNPELYSGVAKAQIDSTGYALEELMEIERAFETCNKSSDVNKFMYNGLMAVVEALGQIHEADKETIQESKLRFAK
jgi:hypothetical protein